MKKLSINDACRLFEDEEREKKKLDPRHNILEALKEDWNEKCFVDYSELEPKIKEILDILGTYGWTDTARVVACNQIKIKVKELLEE